jgi:hypothetical protein
VDENSPDELPFPHRKQGDLVLDLMQGFQEQPKQGPKAQRNCGEGTANGILGVTTESRVNSGGKNGARCRVRTCDPIRVKDVLYR